MLQRRGKSLASVGKRTEISESSSPYSRAVTSLFETLIFKKNIKLLVKIPFWVTLASILWKCLA